MVKGTALETPPGVTTTKLTDRIAVPVPSNWVMRSEGDVDEVTFGTMAVIWVSEFTVKLAEALPKKMAVVPVKPKPVMITTSPGFPEWGL